MNDHTTSSCTLHFRHRSDDVSCWLFLFPAVLNLDLSCAQATVLANGLCVLWHMPTVHASKELLLRECTVIGETEKSIEINLEIHRKSLEISRNHADI